MKFLEDPSLIMSTISGEDNIKNMGETLLQTHKNSRVNVDMTAKVSLQCAMCLFRTAKLKLSNARQRFLSSTGWMKLWRSTGWRR